MMEQEKKVLLLQHFFLYVLCDEGREKILCVIKLFFVYCLSWSKTKKSLCYHIIFLMLSLMKQEKKLILLLDYFIYVLYDGAREKTHFVGTLFFVCCR